LPITIIILAFQAVSLKAFFCEIVMQQSEFSIETKGLREALKKGAEGGVFPGAVLLVAQGGEIVFFDKAGKRALIPAAAPITRDSVFDLASLTKPLATTLALMKLVDQGTVSLDEPLCSLLPGAVPRDKEAITLRLILNHCAGFEDWKPFYLELEKEDSAERKTSLRNRILNMPLVYAPGRETLYSDLGFMILEWLVEERAGMPMPVFLEEKFYGPMGLKRTFFSGRSMPPGLPAHAFAASEDCPWRRKVVEGYVHDENAFALGGYSGHAGLFGTAAEVHVITNMLRSHFRGEREDFLRPETVRTFFTRQGLVRGSTWALGWDTPSLKNSSSGRHFSSNSVGHLGFTGTSLWIDLEKDVVVILLTNRVHPTRNNDRIRQFRPLIHDRVMEGLGFH
jgi:serine-type D-Ala-D-Ala carboxypeptidase